MKKDNLERFIIANRESFDQEIPNSMVWAKIKQQLPKQEAKRFPIRKFLSIAAAMFLLVGMGIIIGLQLAPINSRADGLAVVSKEYAEVEQYYANKINYKMGQLASYKKDKDPLLQKDLNELDNWLLSLRKDLKEVPKGKKETIINAIIDNYKTKLTILDEVLEDIQERKREQEESIQEEIITI